MDAIVPGEKVYLVKRKHRLVLKLQILPIIFILSLDFFFILFIFFKSSSWPNFLVQNFPELAKYNFKFFLIFVFSLFLPIFWGIIFFILMSYYFTYLTITNKRIIFTQLKGLFHLEKTELTFDKIQDISLYIKGILPSFFNFGDIRIQTAGQVGQFYFTSIPHPELVKQVILEAKLDFEKIYGKSSN